MVFSQGRCHREVRRSGPRQLLCHLLGSFALVYLLAAQGQVLWPEEEQRLRVGEKLFPACLTADQNLGEKVTLDGDLLILVVHRGAAEFAQEVASRLLLVERIGGRRLRVRIIEADAVADYRDSRVAGLFLVTPGAGNGLLASWGEHLGALVFSPFVGDVEQGAVAGVHVSDRILPFVNPVQARRAGIRFKPFFLKVAKPYE